MVGDDVETPAPGRRPHERFDSVASSRLFPNHLQNFLSDVGVLSGAAATEHHNNKNNQQESVFESFFDLTDERLSYVFNMFDKEKVGTISYENLRRGLIFQTAGLPESDDFALLDETSFQYLIKHFDLNNSGDICFEEFANGIRKLMLRSLFRQRPIVQEEETNDSTVHVIDYDAVHVDSYYIQQQQQNDDVLLEKGEMSIKEFYFEPGSRLDGFMWPTMNPEPPPR